MSKYIKALHARRRALKECELARRELHDSVEGVVDAYGAHPLTTLAGAAGMGFVLARFRVGSGLMKAGARMATGPAWQLVRPFVNRLG